MKHFFIPLFGVMTWGFVMAGYAQTAPEDAETNSVPTLQAQQSTPEIRTTGIWDEAKLAAEPYDAFLSDSGYVVYPIVQNCTALERKISKNPMVLHRQYIPRRVLVFRRMEGSEGRMMGRQFAIVSEVGSMNHFMVDARDLYFSQEKSDQLDKKTIEQKN